MATAADELLNDFEDSGDENEQEQVDDQYFGESGGLSKDSNGSTSAVGQDGGMEMDGDEEDVDSAALADVSSHMKMEEEETAEETKARVERMELQNVSDVRTVAGLMKQLDPLLQKIEYYKSLPPGQETQNIGNIEDNPEYQLLTQSNTLSTGIDGEIILVHKFIRDHYSVRFPELETLIQNPLDYAKSVAIIGNGPMEEIRKISESSDNIVGQSLKQVLDGPSLMVVTVEATNTSGTPLSESELATVRRACQMILKLDKAKKTLTDYVQSRMSMFAPNLTCLIGSSTAAQLINYTGGISGLAKTPACNLPPLGNKRSARATGLATNVGVRNQGVLYQNDIIRAVPADLKVQAMRILSAKVVLAARIDASHDSPTGEQGLELAEQVEKRINKLSEAPPNSGVKALPAPDDKPSRKRGGRRVRKMKEATAMTELRKAQNRMAFGKEEAEVGYGENSKGLGMIGAQDDGRIRATQVDNRTKAKLSKKNPGWGGATPASSGTATSLRGFGGGPSTAGALKAQGLRASGVGPSGLKTQVGNTGGTVSTIAFTPVQGLELVDPKVREEMNRKRKAEEDRWFKGGTFTQVSSAGANPAPKVDSAGFKVPALPTKRQKQDG
ncbi:Pre-mRNA-processing factor 31 [Lecanosticta acicola]|uniref:Pre-mRNA-processing factor 31 n=1 Tax=Lecanosticta acicola TaxID=111012 RepID=A0AAI8Z5G7_9PEZI|nr:Pre-mRNA-processing factor 31 [Lecanosticta acicola]